MLSVILGNNMYKLMLSVLNFLIVFLAWYILEHIGCQFKGYLTFKLLDTSELVQEFTQEPYIISRVTTV